MVESMLEFEVVESLLALSRNLLAVVERLLAPSFLRVAKICASRRAQIANEKVQYTKDETTHRGFGRFPGSWRGPACALVGRVGCEVRLCDPCVPCVFRLPTRVF